MYEKEYKDEKAELCIAFITKKPIPADAFPEVEINEYKEKKYNFKLKSWNKLNNNSGLDKILKKEGNKNYILDNSECQFYLPVNFTEKEFRKIKKFQQNTWKLLYGNISIEDEASDEMYYLLPMTKYNHEVNINWQIIDNVNQMTTSERIEDVITLGDWISYANYLINNKKRNKFSKDYSFEKNYYSIKKLHAKVIKKPNKLKEIYKNYDESKIDNFKSIEKSLKKIYLVNKFDNTICNFLSLNHNVHVNNSFTIKNKSEDENDKEVAYKEFFEEKYREYMEEKYNYVHESLPLFMYDAHALINSLNRGEEENENEEQGVENTVKKNLYIPEFFNIIAVPQAWIKILPLIPILVYKIKIYCFMNELRYKIGLNYLTVNSLYKASISKSSDPIVGEQHERLEMIGDSILKYFSSINILNCYFNRNEDFLIHKRNDFIKNDFLIDLINKLGWKKYLIKQRFSLRNFKPPNKGIRQPNKKSINLNRSYEKEDEKNDKSVADYYEALIGACFEDGISSKNNNKINIKTLYERNNDTKNKAISLEYGINLCKLFLIRSGNLFTDNWKWEPSIEDISILKTYKKPVKKIAKELNHNINDTTSLFTIINYSKDIYSNYEKSDCKRLKFIGEAVLDLITVIYYYCKKQDAKPKELTECKHMAVAKNSYGKLFTKLNIFHRIDADERIRKEYKKTKRSLDKNTGSFNIPKYFSEIFEVLVGAVFIDNKYNFGKTNFELIDILESKLYDSLEEQKIQFTAINQCIELIQSILKEENDKNKKDEDNQQNKRQNQQVTFE